MATFYIQPQSNKKHTAGSLYQPLIKVPPGASVSAPFFYLSYLRTFIQSFKKMDEEAVEYILEVIHSVINVVNRLIETGYGSMDFQVLAMKLDYLH